MNKTAAPIPSFASAFIVRISLRGEYDIGRPEVKDENAQVKGNFKNLRLDVWWSLLHALGLWRTLCGTLDSRLGWQATHISLVMGGGGFGKVRTG